ncbi:MAG: amidase [Planctomycetes bacterium]|nr:amidase [Planctomycetota bacterium]
MRPSEPSRLGAEEFTVVEASIAELQAALTEGRVTSRRIVEEYLARIGMYDARLRATVAVNPHALEDADRLDRERAAGRVRGPLHGIPIALKDNIQTLDMPTTGGAIAFDGFMAPYEARLVTDLREAGAIILAKTTLTELANWVATGMPNNYNALNGYGMNPYDPRRDPRPGHDDGRAVLDTGGSSSGIGTAANFWAGNVGTETSGSIQIPASNNMLASVKPTVGLISRHGIIPITADQDTAGPMAKHVADLAVLLDAMATGVDANDPATGVCAPPPGGYVAALDRGALQGARIGIPRAYYYEAVTPPGAREPRGGLTRAEADLMRRAIAELERAGAIVVDPVAIPSIVATNADDNQLCFETCYDLPQRKGGDASCSVVLKYGMKRDFDAWLASLGSAAPVDSLTALREFNLAHEQRGAIKYGQAELDISDEMDVVGDVERYLADRAKDLRLCRTEGIDAALEAHDLDALLFPAWTSESMLNKAGYPAVGVPFGFVPNDVAPPLPDGFDPKPLPYGVSFVGTACSEARLLGLAYAFEQLTRSRVAPPEFP